MGLTNNLGKLSNMITSTGSAVGIGTTNPRGFLDVRVASDRGVAITGVVSSESIISGVQGDVSNNLRNLRIAANNLFFNTGDGSNTTGTERMSISAAGAATFTGDIIYNNAGNQNAIITSGAANNGRMYIYSAGAANIGLQAGGSSWFLNSLGIGTNSPDRRLRVSSDGANWISGVFGGAGGTDVVVMGNLTGAAIGGHNSTLTAWAQLSLNPGGGAVYAGTLRIDNNSDQRFKKNITSVENALAIILKLQGRKFNMIDEDNILRYGFVAQEVQLHLSDFVTESTREHKDKNVHITNLLTLETSGASWAALLVEAIKEQQVIIQELNERLNKAGL
jgi:hypothetical protein